MKPFDSISDTLKYFGLAYNQSFYVSSDQKLSQYPHQPFRTGYYSFCICIAGSLNILINGKPHLIKKNCLMIARPSTVISFLDVDEAFRVKLLFFDREFLLKNISDPFIVDRSVFFTDRTYSLICLEDQDINRLVSRLEYIENRSRLKSRFRDEIIRTIIFNLLLEAAELLPNEDHAGLSPKNPKDLYYQFLKLIEENIYFHRDVRYFADLLHVSNKYLIRIVKKASGKTPHEIIDDNLMKEAIVSLGNPAINVTEVAYLLKFNSVSAFGRFFKKHTSVSPALYRKQQSLAS